MNTPTRGRPRILARRSFSDFDLENGPNSVNPRSEVSTSRKVQFERLVRKIAKICSVSLINLQIYRFILNGSKMVNFGRISNCSITDINLTSSNRLTFEPAVWTRGPDGTSVNRKEPLRRFHHHRSIWAWPSDASGATRPGPSDRVSWKLGPVTKNEIKWVIRHNLDLSSATWLKTVSGRRFDALWTPNHSKIGHFEAKTYIFTYKMRFLPIKYPVKS